VGQWDETLAGPEGVGERHKKRLNDLVHEIAGGASNADLLRSDDYREMAFRFGTHIDRTRNALQPLARDWQTRLLILAGPSGTGKSHKAHAIARRYRPEDVYYAVKPTDGKFWMDGYNGQPVVVLDEFDGSWMQRNYFLRLIDKYPFMVEPKGSFTPWLAKFVIITSNQRWESWWKNDDIEPLKRRCTGEIGHMIVMMDKYERPADAQEKSAEEWISSEIMLPTVGRTTHVAAEVPPVGTLTHRANIVDLTDDDDLTASEHRRIHEQLYGDDEGYADDGGVYDSQDDPGRWDDSPEHIEKFLAEHIDTVDDEDPAERALRTDAARGMSQLSDIALGDAQRIAKEVITTPVVPPWNGKFVAPGAPSKPKLTYALPVEKPGKFKKEGPEKVQSELQLAKRRKHGESSF